MDGNSLDIASRVRLVPQQYYTDVNLFDIQINEWNLYLVNSAFQEPFDSAFDNQSAALV